MLHPGEGVAEQNVQTALEVVALYFGLDEVVH
jgi:hypothetical protein